MPDLDLVKARWKPLYSVETPDGVLHHGDTRLVPRAEAEASDHWEPTTPAPAATAAPVKPAAKDEE